MSYIGGPVEALETIDGPGPYTFVLLTPFLVKSNIISIMFYAKQASDLQLVSVNCSSTLK